VGPEPSCDARGLWADDGCSRKPRRRETPIYRRWGRELCKPKAGPREQIRQGGWSDGDKVIVVRSGYVRRRRLQSSRPEMEELKPVIGQSVIQLRTRGAGPPKVELRILYVQTSAIGNGLGGALEKIDFEPFDIDLQEIDRPISDDRIERSYWNSERRDAGRRSSACEVHVVTPKVREDELAFRAADRRVVDLDGQSVQANVAQQVFADARMCFDSDDSSGPGNAHSGREAQLSDICADIDEGFSGLQVRSDEVGVFGAKVPVAPESCGHGAGIETHSVSGRKAEGDKAAQSAHPQSAR